MTNGEAISAASLRDNKEPRHIGKSIIAIVVAIVVIFVLSLGTDVLLHATGVFPPWLKPMSAPLWLLAIGYRVAYGIAGGYLAARLAPAQPMRHAIVLGVIGLVLSIIGAASTWGAGPEFGPKWYPLALVVTALPCAWAGGKIRVNNSKS
jgi:hypothetical protein